MILGRGSRGGRDVDHLIRETLDEIRPLLHIEDATVELVRFDAESGVAHLRVEGDCPDCEMSAANMIEGIAAHLRARVPDVKDVQRMASVNQQ